MKFNNKKASSESRKVIIFFFSYVNKYLSDSNLFRKNYSDNYQDYYNFVFLCGGDNKYYSSRDLLTNVLRKNNKIKIIISEELEELRGNLDLFSFELLLESISKMVLISLESMGTACELGIFTNSNEYNREVVIVNEKYRKDKSFINQGPIEYLKNINNDRIVYAKFGKSNGKTCLVTNSDVINLYKHSLITEPIAFTKWFTIDDKGMYATLSVTNLTTFAAYLLDYYYVFYFGTIEDIIFFIKEAYGVKNVVYVFPGTKDKENKIKNVINTFLKIYVRLGILIFKDDCYFINLKFIKEDNHAHSWAGRIMFINEFTKSYFFQRMLRTSILSRYREYLCL